MPLKEGIIMEINKLEQRLLALKGEREELRQKRLADSFDELRQYDIEILSIERNICGLKKEEYAVPIDLGVNICENPILVSNYGVAFLFIIVDTSKTAVLAFESVEELLFGGINDEVFESHNLVGRGLDVYGEYMIKNSTLKSELRQKNQAHDCYDEAYWNNLEHYLIRTKDGEFSCLAKSFSLKVYDLAIEEAVSSLLTVKYGSLSLK